MEIFFLRYPAPVIDTLYRDTTPRRAQPLEWLPKLTSPKVSQPQQRSVVGGADNSALASFTEKKSSSTAKRV